MSAAQTELLVLQSTSFCNIDCKYCYLPNRSKLNKFDLDLLPVVLNNLCESKLLGARLRLLWHCGEPFTLPLSFFEQASAIIEGFIARTGVKVLQLIQTNATLISQETCNLILKHNISIGVSVDGPAFINDHNRKNRNGRGTFHLVEKGIGLLKANQIDFSVIAVITSYMLDYPDEVFAYFNELNATYIGFNVDELGSTGYTSTLGSDVLSEKRFKAFFSRLWELNRLNGCKLKIREFTEMILNIAGGEVESFDNTLTAPMNIVTVNFDGNFGTFCPELMATNNSQFNLGNVKHDLIGDSIHTAKFRDIYQSINAGVALCQDQCPYYAVCGGGNPSNKFYEHQSLERSETLQCKFTKQYIADVVLENLERSDNIETDLEAYYI